MAQTVNPIVVAGPQANKGYAPAVIHKLSDLSNLSGLFIGSSGPAGALVNWQTASGLRGLKGIQSGTITDGTGLVTLGSGAYIDTQITETNAFTMMVAFRITNTTGNTGLCGTYESVADLGVGMYVIGGSAGTIRASVGKASGADNIALAGGTSGIWQVCSLSVPESGAATLTNHTAGVTVTSSNADARVTPAIDTMRIGAQRAAGFSNNHENGATLFWRGVALSQPQLASHYAALQTHAAIFGLTW